MSNRYNYDQGSSRSARDDSRTHKDRHGYTESEDRSRSRSPQRRLETSRRDQKEKEHSNKYSKHRSDDRRKDRKASNDWDGSDEEVPAPPPPPRISKISIALSKPVQKIQMAPIKMNLGSPAVKPSGSAPQSKVASVFNTDDDDDEPEEMPAEARMRMRNIGRETPTSAGPNSFGKTKQGFCDAKKVFEKNLKQALETADKPPLSSQKFPQTIYKINGP